MTTLLPLLAVLGFYACLWLLLSESEPVLRDLGLLLAGLAPGAFAYAALLVFGSPYLGELRAAIQAAFPGSARLIIGGALAVGLAAAVFVAISRIRTRRALRYMLLAAALAAGGAFAVVNGTGSADVDVVERAHFAEYGLLALLLYRGWRLVTDWTRVGLPRCRSGWWPGTT